MDGYILEKLYGIKKCMESQFMEREDVIEIIFLGILSKQHVILIGGPGLAKTAMLRALAVHVKMIRLFDFQMTPLTRMENLLAVESRTGIGIDNCDIAFIDEFFKGPPETLNSLLSIMNERIIYKPAPGKIPLLSLFATSNEKPDKSSGEGMLPLYDRFLLRKEILPVSKRENFKRMLSNDGRYDSRNLLLDIAELGRMAEKAENVKISREIYDALFNTREELAGMQVSVSDRRWRDTVRVLKGAAFLKGRDYVIKDDLRLAESSLWTYYSDIRPVRNVLGRMISSER